MLIKGREREGRAGEGRWFVSEKKTEVKKQGSNKRRNITREENDRKTTNKHKEQHTETSSLVAEGQGVTMVRKPKLGLMAL